MMISLCLPVLLVLLGTLNATNTNPSTIKELNASIFSIKLKGGTLDEVVGGLFLTDYKHLTAEQHALLVASAPVDGVIEAAVKFICYSPIEVFEKVNFQVILAFIKSYVEPSMYFKYCNHQEHLLPATELVIDRLLKEPKLQTSDILRTMLYSMMILNEHGDNHVLFGKYAIAKTSSAEITLATIDKLTKNPVISKEMVQSLLAPFENGAMSQVYQDLVSGRAYNVYAKSPFSDKQQRDAVVLISIMPKVFTKDFVSQVEEYNPKYALLICKILLLKFYNPFSVYRGKSAITEENIAFGKYLWCYIESKEDVSDLQSAFYFSYPAFFIPITSKSDDELNERLSKMEIIQVEINRIESRLDFIPTIFTHRLAVMAYWKNLYLEKLAQKADHEFMEKAFEFYSTNTEEIDGEMFLRYLKTCPNPQKFLNVCKHQSRDVDYVYQIISRITKLNGAAIAAESLLLSLAKECDGTESPMFGKFGAPKPEYLVNLSKMDLFKNKEALSAIHNFLVTRLEPKNNETVYEIRRAYGAGLINILPVSCIKLTPSQQRSNVLLWKVAPFLLSKDSFDELFALKKTNTIERKRLEYLAFIQLAAYHNPEFDQSACLPFEDSVLRALSCINNKDTAFAILRLIVWTQPQAFLAIMTSKTFNESEISKLPRAHYKLSQACKWKLSSTKTLSVAEHLCFEMANEVIKEQCLFDYKRCVDWKAVSVLFKINQDFEAYIQKISTFTHDQFIAAISWLLEHAKNSEEFKSLIVKCLPMNRKCILEPLVEKL